MPPQITDDIKQEILDRTDLVALISEQVPLKRAGKSWKGRCPFHQEKDPSFNVVPDKGFYYCFGCQASGNAITFLQKTQGMGFVEAVEALAKRAGIRLPEARGPRDRMRESQLELIEAAARFFEESLRSDPGAEAREILGRRGFSEDIRERFRIGYAPKGWHKLADHLLRKGARDKDLIRARLAGERNKRSGEGRGVYDLFRNRIIFPICNLSGKVIAFGGRTVDPEDEPKYLNSPETDLFKKGSQLYGLHLAKRSIRESEEAMIVEGYTDLISLHQHGFENTVATLGTALTSTHWRLLHRFTKKVCLVFDADSAGERAAIRGIDLLLEEDVLPNVIELPGGSDPDSLLRDKGPEIFRELVSKAQEAYEYRMDKVIGPGGAVSGEDRVRALRELAPVLALIGSPARRAFWVGRTAERLRLREEDVYEEIRETRGQTRVEVSLEERVDDKDPTRQARIGLMALLLAGIPVQALLRKTLAKAPTANDCDSILERLMEISEASDEISPGLLSRHFDAEEQRLIAQASLGEPVPEKWEKALDEYLKIVQQGYISYLQGQNQKKSEEECATIDCLRTEHELARQRLQLGKGDGFRVPPSL